MSIITKTVEVEVETFEDDYREILDRSAVFLDALVDAKVVMPLTPFMRQELLNGARDLRSVMA